MLNELNTHVLRAGAPSPSVETLLHALLPHKYVDHTHADAVLAISNAPDGEKRIREIYGERVAVMPYVMAGFDLAAHCAREFPKQATGKTVGMVLVSHGIFSFGAEARESYERMIELVSMAEEYLQKKKAWHIVLAAQAGPAASSARRSRACRRAVSDAGGLSGGAESQHAATNSWRFAQHPKIAELSQKGPATPDHLLFIKPVPMLGRDAAEYARSYRAYFEKRMPPRRRKTMLDPAPRAVLDPQLGFAAAGRDAREARDHRGPLRAQHRRHPARRGARRLARRRREPPVRHRVLGSRAGEGEEGRRSADVQGRGGAGHRRRIGNRQGLRRRFPAPRRGGRRPGPQSRDRHPVAAPGFSRAGRGSDRSPAPSIRP